MHTDYCVISKANRRN